MSREINITVYEINELSEEAKQKAFSDFCRDDDYPYERENEATLKAFEKIFPIEIDNWEYGSGSCYVSFDNTEDDDIMYSMKGIRLLKYLWNTYSENLYSRKRYSLVSKEQDNNAIAKTKDRYSKVILTSCCELTGYCMDEAILEPIYEFMKHPDKSVGFHTLINKCLRGWVEACNNDYWAYFDMENFIETSEANDWEYHEDGTLYV